ncbi:hypothetical protein [Mesorhizobium sp. M0870]|uniref:hypothetical protein n=2 Tax=unclassified Mesorhizobium TaxID=325217 RepID=UPI003338C067
MLADIDVQTAAAETLGARLASVDIYAVGALLHRLNLQFRDSARLDRQVARDCDIAAQNAAAKALRASGLCQLVGTVLTSAFAIAGAGLSFQGARKAQARFDAEIGGWKARNGKTSFQTEVSKPATKPDPEISLEGSQPPHVAVTPVTKPDPEIVEVDQPPPDLGKAATKRDPETLPEDSQPPGVDLTGIYRAQQVAQQTTMTWSGVATGISELGKIAGAGLNMAATIEQEKKAKLDAEDTEIRSRAEDETEYKSAYERMINDVLETLSEVRRADAETRSKIANMG